MWGRTPGGDASCGVGYRPDELGGALRRPGFDAADIHPPELAVAGGPEADNGVRGGEAGAVGWVVEVGLPLGRVKEFEAACVSVRGEADLLRQVHLLIESLETSGCDHDKVLSFDVGPANVVRVADPGGHASMFEPTGDGIGANRVADSGVDIALGAKGASQHLGDLFHSGWVVVQLIDLCIPNIEPASAREKQRDAEADDRLRVRVQEGLPEFRAGNRAWLCAALIE